MEPQKRSKPEHSLRMHELSPRRTSSPLTGPSQGLLSATLDGDYGSPPRPATSVVAVRSLMEVRLEMTTCWKFSVGLSLILFLATLAVVSVLTPAAQEVAGKINDPTLKAAAAIKNAVR